MKYLFFAALILLCQKVKAQSQFPDFLEGSWKVMNKPIFEHWTKLNPTTLQGFGYELKDGKIVVKEYLKVVTKRNKICYVATVVNQNHGNDINFNLTSSDSVFLFQNLKHDFPKQIAYTIINDSTINVD